MAKFDKFFKSGYFFVTYLVAAVLIFAAIMKVHQILTVPPTTSISGLYEQLPLWKFAIRVWDTRPFLISHVPIELGLAIWLVSGIFRKGAWLASIIAFAVFICVTSFKWYAGDASCGCFGTFHVAPWKTLFLIDIPAFVLLLIFRPKGYKLFEWPSLRHLMAAAVPSLLLLSTVTAGLMLSPVPQEQKAVDWEGQQWELLEHIDIADKISEGVWIVLMYHWDCPTCREEAVPAYEQMSRMMAGQIQIAYIEIPPYGPEGKGPIPEDTPNLVGKLDESKKWMIVSPTVVLLANGEVVKTWQVEFPMMDEIFQAL